MAPPGRGAALAIGARASHGEVLLFLHAVFGVSVCFYQRASPPNLVAIAYYPGSAPRHMTLGQHELELAACLLKRVRAPAPGREMHKAGNSSGYFATSLDGGDIFSRSALLRCGISAKTSRIVSSATRKS